MQCASAKFGAEKLMQYNGRVPKIESVMMRESIWHGTTYSVTRKAKDQTLALESIVEDFGGWHRKVTIRIRPSEADERIREELQKQLNQDDSEPMLSLGELETKESYWSSFQSTKDNMTLEEAEDTWSSVQTGLPALRARFLKPSEAYRRTQEELQERVRNAEKACEEKTCQDLWDKPEKKSSHNNMSMLITLHNDCIEQYKKEQRSFDMLEQLDMKQQYWIPFQLVKERMTYSEARALWLEVKTALPLLLPRLFRPAPEDKVMRQDVEGLIKQEEKQYLFDLLTELDTKWQYDILVSKVVEEMTYEEVEKFWLENKGMLPQLLANDEWASQQLLEQQLKTHQWRYYQTVWHAKGFLTASTIRDLVPGPVSLLTVNAEDSLDLLNELDMKLSYWSYFKSVEEALTLEEAETFLSEIKSELQLLMEEHQQLDRIERILKPSVADLHLQHELEKRIKKVEETCSTEDCKALLEEPTEGETRTQTYDECMKQCREKEQYPYDKFEELEKKKVYWGNFSEARKSKTPEDALAYWTKIKVHFKVTEEEQLQLEKAEPSTAHENLYKELSNRITEAERGCRGLREKLMEENNKTIEVFEKLMNAYDECMNKIKEREQKSLRLQEELRVKRGTWDSFQYEKDESLELALAFWTSTKDAFTLLEEVSTLEFKNLQFNKDSQAFKLDVVI
ncbi:hypothetical protein TTRE_0000135501 [Trichuris trichiura]|uniref:Uncharacterized protein n=1 Tax=Trichuris trichiura TaxID=36087 RepID=A0A077YYA6_TRITR|nr:hypothetical protein TTRE_0000135501 [Trichuris trichiura]